MLKYAAELYRYYLPSFKHLTSMICRLVEIRQAYCKYKKLLMWNTNWMGVKLQRSLLNFTSEKCLIHISFDTFLDLKTFSSVGCHVAYIPYECVPPSASTKRCSGSPCLITL